MIIKEHFLSEIKKLADLTGQRVMASVASLLFDELQNTDYQDFRVAINKLKYSDKKITLGNLTQVINEAMSIRMEKENQVKQLKDREYATKFWRENKDYISQGLCNRKCITCLVKYCDVIHTHSIQAMRDMLQKTKTLIEVNKEMSDKFQGWNSNFIPEPF